MPAKPKMPPVECLNNLQAIDGVDVATIGIHGMLVSVIYRSYLDLCSHEQQVKREAEHFFRSKEIDSPYGFTFLGIVQELGLPLERILRAVKERCPNFDSNDIEPVPLQRARKLCRFRAFSGRSNRRWR